MLTTKATRAHIETKYILEKQKYQDDEDKANPTSRSSYFELFVYVRTMDPLQRYIETHHVI